MEKVSFSIYGGNNEGIIWAELGWDWGRHLLIQLPTVTKYRANATYNT